MKKALLFISLALIVGSLGCGGGHFSSGGGSFSPKFEAGIAHVSGNYGFTLNNYLVEGAQKISDLGSDSIFIYLTPYFRAEYPDQSSNQWPAADPSSVAALAQSKPYDTVLNLPFRTIVMTVYSFANADGIAGISASPARLKAEENEFYQLTKYLYSEFAGSGKTFVLKNWEGDWIGLGQGNVTGNISPGMVQDMIAWLSARQRGVTRARNEAGKSSGVRVFNAAEVNRVLDYAQNGMTRVINAVIPKVKADMVTYSSYDSTAIGNDAQTVQSGLKLALKTIEKMAPDPMGLGNRRILISEYGLYENQLVGGTTWRPSTILSTASKEGIYGAFLWNVYDNECAETNGQSVPVDTATGNPLRPHNNQCRGLWVVRPDGSTSSVVSVLKQYW